MKAEGVGDHDAPRVASRRLRPVGIRRSIVEGFSAEAFLAADRGGLNILRAPDAVRVALLRLSGRASEGMPV